LCYGAAVPRLRRWTCAGAPEPHDSDGSDEQEAEELRTQARDIQRLLVASVQLQAGHGAREAERGAPADACRRAPFPAMFDPQAARMILLVCSFHFVLHVQEEIK